MDSKIEEFCIFKSIEVLLDFFNFLKILFYIFCKYLKQYRMPHSMQVYHTNALENGIIYNLMKPDKFVPILLEKCSNSKQIYHIYVLYFLSCLSH